jgi:hypothetical protein
LPPIAPDLGNWHGLRVHRDCHVQFAGCFYSVPFVHIGQAMWLRATDGANSNSCLTIRLLAANLVSMVTRAMCRSFDLRSGSEAPPAPRSIAKEHIVHARQ